MSKLANATTHAVRTGLVVCLALLLVAPAAEARKKGRKKKTEPAASAVDVVQTAERSLWAYDTGGARETLETVEKEAAPEVMVAMARVLEQEKSYGEAAKKLRTAAELLPDDPAPLVYLGETYLHAKSEKEAERAFAQAEDRANALLSREPGNVAAQYYLGIAQQRQKKFSEAIETFEKALRADPGDARIVYQLGVTHAFQKNWQQAVDILTEAILKDPGLAYAYYYRGLAAGQAGRKDLLLNDLDRFLFMAPDAPESERARQVRQAG